MESGLPGFDADFALSLSAKASHIMNRHFSPYGVLHTNKEGESGNLTPLTAADTEINKVVIDEIRARFPKRGAHRVSIKGEEGSDEVTGAAWSVSFDPLDGTFPYKLGLPLSTFSLALCLEGEPVLAVISYPACDQTTIAVKGKGAFLNKRQVFVSAEDKLSSKSMVGACWWSVSKYNVGAIAASLPKKTGTSVIDLLSIALMGSKVAHGLITATIFPGKDAHDSSAIQLIVSEAGGKVTSILGEHQLYDREVCGHLASNGRVHDELLERIRECQ